MIQRPSDMTSFEFVILSGLRAAQLMRGCIPRIQSTHKLIMVAQMEVADHHIIRTPPAELTPAEPV